MINSLNCRRGITITAISSTSTVTTRSQLELEYSGYYAIDIGERSHCQCIFAVVVIVV